MIVYAKQNPQAKLKINDGIIPEGYTAVVPPEENEGFKLYFDTEWIYEEIPKMEEILIDNI